MYSLALIGSSIVQYGEQRYEITLQQAFLMSQLQLSMVCFGNVWAPRGQLFEI